MSEFQEAEVLWFNNIKGYGFAITNDNEKVFLHYSNIESNQCYKTLDNGQKIKLQKGNSNTMGSIRAKVIIPSEVDNV